MRGSGHNSSNFHGGLASLALTVWQVAGVLWRRVEVSSLGIYYLDAGASHRREMINLGRGDYRFQVSCIDCYVSFRIDCALRRRQGSSFESSKSRWKARC
jgi:hypothetical protein